MSKADVTYHHPTAARYSDGNIAGIWPAQRGDSQQLDFAGGNAEGEVMAAPSIARVVPDAACRVAVVDGDGTATVANSRLLLANQEHPVALGKGKRLGFIAA